MATIHTRARAAEGSVLGNGLVVEGSVSCGEALVVHGIVRGPVRCEAGVELGEGGTIEGDVHGTTVRVAGTLTGDVRASERIELVAGARVRGDLHAPRITIADGATFRGRVEMGGGE